MATRFCLSATNFRLDFAAELRNRRLWHDPRHRQCNLASLTSLAFEGDELKAIVYTEPAADLVAKAQKGAGA